MWVAKEREHNWVQVLSPLLTLWPWTSLWSVLLILTTPKDGVLFPFCRDLLRNVKSGSTVCWGWNPGRLGSKTHGISILVPSPWIMLFQVISAEFSSILTLGPRFLRIQFLSLVFGSRAPWREKNGNVPSYSRRNRNRSEVILDLALSEPWGVSTLKCVWRSSISLTSGKVWLLYFLKELKILGKIPLRLYICKVRDNFMYLYFDMKLIFLPWIEMGMMKSWKGGIQKENILNAIQVNPKWKPTGFLWKVLVSWTCFFLNFRLSVVLLFCFRKNF